MLPSFLTGAIAGYAIAIPVGAIALLIVDLGVRRGFRVAAAAGAGAATADGLYAALAAAGGGAIALLLAPFESWLRVIAAGALLGIALRGLARLLIASKSTDRGPAAAQPIATYLRFVGLTLLNPATVIYFAALILGLPALGREPGERVAFVLGAFLASLSWQTVLAAVGALAHHRLPPRFQAALSVLGNLLILAFAVGVARGVG